MTNDSAITNHYIVSLVVHDKGQLISECLFDFFFQKTNEKFDNALTQNLKSGQINKINNDMIYIIYDYMGYLMYYIAFILCFYHVLDSENQKNVLKLTDL